MPLPLVLNTLFHTCVLYRKQQTVGAGGGVAMGQVEIGTVRVFIQPMAYDDQAIQQGAPNVQYYRAYIDYEEDLQDGDMFVSQQRGHAGRWEVKDVQPYPVSRHGHFTHWRCKVSRILDSRGDGVTVPLP